MAMIFLYSYCFCLSSNTVLLFFCKMSFLAPQSIRGVNANDGFVAFSCLPWFHCSLVNKETTPMPHVYDSHMPDNIPLFALDWVDVCTHMCASESELKAPEECQRSFCK